MDDHENAEKVTINRLGILGDGIGKFSADPSSANIYVPFTLPGEEVLADCEAVPARLISVEKKAANRIPAICEHFTQCGGCQMQHVEQKSYAEWKLNILKTALNEQSIEEKLEEKIKPLIQVPLGTRRRAVFSATRIEGEVCLGFLKRQSHDLIALKECPLLHQVILQALPKLREIASLAAPHKSPLKMQVIACENGLDVTLSNLDAIGNKLRRSLTLALENCPIIRLSNEDEIILEKEKPFVVSAGHSIYLQPNAFCQASEEAEKIMGDLIKTHLKKSKHIVDLFSGSGAFSFTASNFAKTHAIEVNASAIDALNTSRSKAMGIKPLTATVRDLFRRPLLSDELKPYDGAIFDPPRSGAKQQMEGIIKSSISKLVAISCNPSTLAEDLRQLKKGGFNIKLIQPIDQFLYSPHLEVVVLLERKVAEKRKKIFG